MVDRLHGRDRRPSSRRYDAGRRRSGGSTRPRRRRTSSSTAPIPSTCSGPSTSRATGWAGCAGCAATRRREPCRARRGREPRRGRPRRDRGGTRRGGPAARAGGRGRLLRHGRSPRGRALGRRLTGRRSALSPGLGWRRVLGWPGHRCRRTLGAGCRDLGPVPPQDVGQPDDEDDDDERDAQRPGQVEQGRHDEGAERRAHRGRQPGRGCVAAAGRERRTSYVSWCGSDAWCSSWQPTCSSPRVPSSSRPTPVQPRQAGAGHGHRPRTQFSSRCSPASPDFSGWNWVAVRGPFSTAATNFAP